jgi:hypothetical protein
MGIEAGVFLGFLALAVRATWPLGRDLGGFMLTRVDPFTDLWSLHWVTSHFFEPSAILQGNIFYPQPHAVIFSHVHFGLMPFLLPLHLLVRDPVTLYNSALLVALAFSGWAWHWLVYQRTGSRAAGLLTGVLATFSSHQMYHVLHLPLLCTGWVALFLLGLHRLIERPSLRSGLFCGAAFGLTVTTTGYYGTASAVLGAVFAVGHVREFRVRTVAWAAVAVLLAAVVILPYARPFMALRRSEPAFTRPPELSAELSFNPALDLSSRAYAYSRWLPPLGERFFPGLLAIGLVGVALVRRGRDFAFYAAAFVLLLVISLGPRTPFYTLLYSIPPLTSMRHPWTFATVALLLFYVLAGLGWARSGLAAKAWAGPLVVGLAVLETLGPGPRLVRYPRGLPPAYERLLALPPGPILEVPVYAEATMLWAARHGMPVVNGSSAFIPTRTRELRESMQREWLEQAPVDVDATESARRLRSEFGLRYLILPTGRQKDVLDGADRAGMARLGEALERSRTFRLLEVVPDGDRIYEVAGAAAQPMRASDGNSFEK